MKIYTVGGYVRDKLMNLDPKDCDFVVVGSNTEEMESLGYKQVGKDFPVFLHPITGDEYALARIERKTGTGYNGFNVDVENVTLEEDLFRRDLTINAMALDNHDNLIDPYGGQEDLKNGILRHVSSHFNEDPVRILRIARFSARYNFTIAPETSQLMHDMVINGEFDNLTGERVWKEFEKVLSEKYISNFFEQLDMIGAFEKIPGFKSIQEKEYLNYVVEHHFEKRFLLNLLHIFSNMNKDDLNSWKMPADLIQKINQFSNWQNTEGFYQFLSEEDKLLFIQQNKGLHENSNIEEILYAVHSYQTWKHNKIFDLNIELFMLNKDIALLKELNYEDIVKTALDNKQKPNIAVREAQIKKLTTTLGYKL